MLSWPVNHDIGTRVRGTERLKVERCREPTINAWAAGQLNFLTN